MNAWHTLSTEIALKELKSSPKGLSKEESIKRQEIYGLNELVEKKRVSAWKIFLAQFNDLLVIILMAAAILSYLSGIFLNEKEASLDTILIVIILVANGTFGFFQNYKAERSIEKLKSLTTPTALVLRNGHKEKVDTKNLVPGDILFLEEGMLVPADARLIESHHLRTDESNLTGESLPDSKMTLPLKKETALGDRKNMIYMSSIILEGSGLAMITETGMQTEVGKIAKQLEKTQERPTPFQQELGRLGKKIGVMVIGLAILIVITEVIGSSLSGDVLFPMLIFGASLAVAAVPEGLPAVVTVGLAVGSRRMVQKKALVRHLAIVESLGSVDVICTDKTGTLTEEKMTVRKVYVNGKIIEVTGQGYETRGDFLGVKKVDQNALEWLLKTGVLCNNAEWQNETKFVGDPTEIALLVTAQKRGIGTELLNDYVRLDENSFSSNRKMMSVVFDHQGTSFLFAKGAPEMILKKCTHVLEGNKVVKLTPSKIETILNTNNTFAENALRVLGFAYQENTNQEENLIFVGLQGMIDPPRKEVPQAIKECKKAGIRIIMITGDHPITAAAIAKELKISTGKVLTGEELDKLSPEQLKNKLKTISVFARVNPEHKVNILKALQEEGHLVAMTGDGVNDAPAVKQADVGIVMGIRGTDVAKQASDMVLLDDNFATIRSAIQEGRGIFDNISKFTNYLLSTNAGEVLLIVFALLYGKIFYHQSELILPILAVHLLWINLLTDGLPALALSVDPIEKNIMNRRPASFNQGIINRSNGLFILLTGILMASIGLTTFIWNSEDLTLARTITFTMLVVLELVKIQQVRMQYQLSLFSNPWLVAAIVICFLLQLLILYTPLASFFQVIPLHFNHWLQIGLGVVVFWIFSRIMNLWQKRMEE